MFSSLARCLAGCVFTACLPLASPAPAAEETASLANVLAEVQATHPELRAADHTIAAARERLGQARALEPPTVSYQAGKLATGVSHDEHEASIRLGQSLPFPLQRTRAAALAQIDVAIAEQQRSAIALRLRGAATRAYRRLQGDGLTLVTLRSLHDVARDVERTSDTRLQAGTARYLDILRARLESARLENDILESERALREDRRSVNVLRGRDPEAAFEPSDTLTYQPVTDSLAAVLQHAQESRPRSRVARLERDRARAAAAVARSDRLPTFDLAAGLDRVPGAAGPGVGVEISVSLPFLPWTNRAGRVREALAETAAADAALENTERSVMAVVRNAYETARTTEQQVGAFQRSLLPDAADALAAAVRGYQYGQLGGLELFETMRTYRETQLEYVRSLLSAHLALTDLETAE